MGCESEILKRIKEESGLALNKSVDFEILAQAIYDKTKEHLGVNTLRRIFGYKIEKVNPRKSTLDILARYLGFSDYEALVLELGEDANISAFAPIECLEISQLNLGDRIKIHYEPNRSLILEFLGDSLFKVVEVNGSKNLQSGDELVISQVAVGHRLVVPHVYRLGKDLGVYEAAKSKGILGVELIN